MTHFSLKTCYLMYLEGFQEKKIMIQIFFSQRLFGMWVSDGLEHIFQTKWLRMSHMVLFCSFFNYLSNAPLEPGSNLGIWPLKSSRSSWLPSTKKCWIFRDIWVRVGSRGVTPVCKKIHKWYLLLLYDRISTKKPYWKEKKRFITISYLRL